MRCLWESGGRWFYPPRLRDRYTPERVLSGFRYRGSARGLIKALKYKRVRPVVKVLADLLVGDLQEKDVVFGPQAIVVPVPLSFWREGARGFNQASLLGKALAEKLDLQFRSDILNRVKDRPSQVSLSRAERSANVKGVFTADVLNGEDIILVDDILTTGATVREAAKILKKAGSKQVWILTFARD